MREKEKRLNKREREGGEEKKTTTKKGGSGVDSHIKEPKYGKYTNYQC